MIINNNNDNNNDNKNHHNNNNIMEYQKIISLLDLKHLKRP